MQPVRLQSIFAPPSRFDEVLATYFPYCMLGAISPDYPNLARNDVNAWRWADAMHYTRVCQMITAGVNRVRMESEVRRDKQMAWLLGYCAHVVTDMTIHPIVQAKVGVYAENQRQHRVCEMNQDSWIYRRMNSGEIGASDSFALIVARCSDATDRSVLDGDIVKLWGSMCADVHPELHDTYLADTSAWHREFIAMSDESASCTERLFPLAGRIAAKMGLAYPPFAAIDRQFIDRQLVPSEKPRSLDYDDIFDHTVDRTAILWRQVEQAVYGSNPAFTPLGEWNLDNGRDETGRLVFWE
jgi:hypothetical protein